MPHTSTYLAGHILSPNTRSEASTEHQPSATSLSLAAFKCFREDIWKKKSVENLLHKVSDPLPAAGEARSWSNTPSEILFTTVPSWTGWTSTCLTKLDPFLVSAVVKYFFFTPQVIHLYLEHVYSIRRGDRKSTFTPSYFCLSSYQESPRPFHTKEISTRAQRKGAYSSCPGACPVGFWETSRIETPPSPWATCDSIQSPSRWKTNPKKWCFR